MALRRVFSSARDGLRRTAGRVAGEHPDEQVVADPNRGQALRVAHHIWVGSKAVWDEIGGAGVQHAEGNRLAAPSCFEVSDQAGQVLEQRLGDGFPREDARRDGARQRRFEIVGVAHVEVAGGPLVEAVDQL